MPIKMMTVTPAPGHLIQICAACGAEHTIHFDRGSQKSKTGPFALKVGDTLSVKVDGTDLEMVTFEAGAFPDFENVSATQLAAKLNSILKGSRAKEDFGGVLIESVNTGAESQIEITDGTARAALGFPNTLLDSWLSRPVLGVRLGNGDAVDKNVISLRQCSDCGATESLYRTFDISPPELAGTFFHEHRKAVNALAEHMKSRGWSHPHAAAHHAAETEKPHDMEHEFPAKPCTPPPCEIARPGRRAQVGGGT
jgi:hypothetical protein